MEWLDAGCISAAPTGCVSDSECAAARRCLLREQPKESNMSKRPTPSGNPMVDQINFMRAAGQTTLEPDVNQARLYGDLILEEDKELHDAFVAVDAVEMVDGAVDGIVVRLGFLLSLLGPNAQRAWDIIVESNFEKIDPQTGMVRRRADGKILKPEGWVDPKEKIRALLREARLID